MRNSGQTHSPYIIGTRYLIPILLGVLVSGEFAESASFKDRYGKKFSSRTQPAKVTTETRAALIEKGYMEIGHIKTKRFLKSVCKTKYVTDPCVSSQSKTVCKEKSHRDPKQELLKEAAKRGGDLVILREYGVNFLNDFNSRQVWCKNLDGWIWKSISSKTYVGSAGFVWRYEPVLGRFQRLDEAIRNGRIDDVRDLITDGVDVNAKTDSGGRFLSGAIGRGHPEIVRMLIDNGHSVETSNLRYAAFGYGPNGPEIVRTLLEKITNVNERDDRSGSTALHNAVSELERDIVELLLKAGANPNLPCKSCGFRSTPETPLMVLSKRFRLHQRHPPSPTEILERIQEIHELLREYGAIGPFE